MYLPLEPTSLYYPNPLGFPRPSSSASNCNDEQQLMRYQNQLWDNLRSVASPYTTSLYQNVPIPNHHYGPAFTLPPTGRPRSAQPPLSPLSPSSTLPRPSRIRRSQNYQQQNSSQRSRSLDRPRSLSESVQEPSFIKPLPCKCQNSPPTKNNSPLPLRNNLHDLMRPLVLDPPPVGHSKAVQTETCYRQNNNPVILLTQSESNKNGDSMPKIVESEDDCSDEERLDFVSELPRLLRRNSQ